MEISEIFYWMRTMSSRSGVVSTLAGSSQGIEDGTGATAKFNFPRSVALDAGGNVYVADGSSRIRKITPNGDVSTLAGSTAGFEDGLGADAQFSGLRGIAVDTEFNIYVTDFNNHKIRKITQE